MGMINYNNIPENKPTSSSDATLKVFDGVNSNPLQLNNQQLIAMTGFLETRGFKSPSAEQTAIAILKQAKIDGYDGMQILNTLKGTTDVVLSSVVGEIINYSRFKTSTLGLATNVTPVDDIQRNILA
jgi:hypothetical protein